LRLRTQLHPSQPSHEEWLRMDAIMGAYPVRAGVSFRWNPLNLHFFVLSCDFVQCLFQKGVLDSDISIFFLLLNTFFFTLSFPPLPSPSCTIASSCGRSRSGSVRAMPRRPSWCALYCTYSFHYLSFVAFDSTFSSKTVTARFLFDVFISLAQYK
jgi:hypothetical protein